MNDDPTFLRAIIAAPDDPGPRLAYADWLEGQGDPRANLLRQDWDDPHLSFVDWVAQRGDLSDYLRHYPDLRDRVAEHTTNQRRRDQRAALGAAIDPGWLAWVDTVAHPFRPFFFWSNSSPRSYGPGELPFGEPLGTRGAVVTFASALRGATAGDPALHADLIWLSQLPPGDCEYGAASCPVHPFVADLAAGGLPLTGADVLRALRASSFRSAAMPQLSLSTLPYPRRVPGNGNDQIHTDPTQQTLFPRPADLADESQFGDDEDQANALARHAVHERLRDAVVGRQLWYVLLHSDVGPHADEFGRGPHVVLFAVGQSLRSDHLIGVVSHQVCHNLCD